MQEENIIPKNANDKEIIKTFHQETTFFAWDAPSRPWKKRTKAYYSSSILISFFIEIILFLFSQYIIMMTVAAFIFLIFILATVEPKNFHYRVTREGILIEDHFYIWEELYDFYIQQRFGRDVVYIHTRSILPGILLLVVNSGDLENVKELLTRHIAFREFIKPTITQMIGAWLTKLFPLEEL